MKQLIQAVTAAAMLATLGGCATIMGTDTHVMPIASTPTGATVMVTDEKGAEVFKGETPTSVTLKKSDGSYFGKKSYTISISKPGFIAQSVPVTASASGWYLLGNLAFGGVIGWLIVDPLNGKMYNLSPEAINSTLPADAKTSHNNSARDGSIAVVMLQQVPMELRARMLPVN